MASDIRRTLDRIAQRFQASGMTNEITGLEQLAHLLLLKLLDEEESAPDQGGGGNHGQLYPGQADRYRWSRWKRKRGPALCDFLSEEVFAYMASLMREAPWVADYFRDATLEIRDPAVIEEAIDALDAIALRAPGPRVTGEAFEHLLGRLDHADTGWVRTPHWICSFMLEMMDPRPGDRICDPACGTGGFLVDVVEHLRTRHGKMPHDLVLHGIEVSPPIWRIATLNLLLHGARHVDLRLANALSARSGLSPEERDQRCTLVLSNPPFGTQLSPNIPVRPDLPTSSRRLELLFLALTMASLAPGGRCAVVVPESLLFGTSKAHVELRRGLVEDFHLLAVISLPVSAFRPHLSVRTAVLVFRRPDADEQRASGEVWFYALDEGAGEDRSEPPDENEISAFLAQWQQYESTGFAQPLGARAGTMLAPGSEAPRCWWAPVETLAENAYDLSPARYAPILDETPDEDPAVLIREVLAMERDIQEGLEKLLGELESAR